MSDPITVQTTINAPIETVWDCWNDPKHITHWAFASDDWEAPSAENDLRVGGKFKIVMAARDGSARFDFEGTYSEVVQHSRISYIMDDGRKVTIEFAQTPQGVEVIETFDPEQENTRELQQAGWQAILDNFKKYVESV